MISKDTQGKVIPFKQDAEFYLKRGAKDAEKNDLLNALINYRKALSIDPNDGDTVIAVAEILSQMQRFEESNRMLFLLMSMGEPTTECYFGLACNYFGMREFSYAEESLENYLNADPDGFFAADAEDLLDLLDDDDAMAETTGLSTDEDYDTCDASRIARHYMDAGQYRQAIETLEKHLETYPDSVSALNQLCLAWYCAGDRKKAMAHCEAALAKAPENIPAHCNRALLLKGAGDTEEARQELDWLTQQKTDAVEDLQGISVLQLEAGRFDEAKDVLERLYQLAPFDESTIHKLGYCRYMRGEFERAAACYRRLLTIDPTDTVAKYYLEQCRKAETQKHILAGKWQIPYQVPFSEVFHRLSAINRYLSTPVEELGQLWKENEEFRDLLRWALSLPEQRAKRNILSLIFLLQDGHAERLLREFLLRTDQPDEDKRIVFGMLKHMQAKEPYMAYLGGQWIQGHVNMMIFPQKVPASYEGVMRQLLQSLGDAPNEECVAAALRIFTAYLDGMNGKYPRISVAQQSSYAAALEFLGAKTCGEDLTEEAICKKYRISQTRLHNALSKMQPSMEEK